MSIQGIYSRLPGAELSKSPAETTRFIISLPAMASTNARANGIAVPGPRLSNLKKGIPCNQLGARSRANDRNVVSPGVDPRKIVLE